MSDTTYPNYSLPVHRLAGTPHVYGAKQAVGEVRKAVKDLAAVLVTTGWAVRHPIGPDTVGLSVIELIDQLGPAERHVLRVVTSLLVKATKSNGYHNN